MIFLVFLIIVFDGFVRNALANQAKSQKNDDNSKDQGWEIAEKAEKWVEVDAKICSQIRENDVVKQDVNTQCNQQDTSKQMSALEKLCDFPNIQGVQMEQKIVVRKKFIAHRAKVECVKECVKPDDRKDKSKDTKSQNTGNSENKTECQHEGDAPLHVTEIHLSGSRPQAKYKGKNSTFSHIKNSFWQISCPKNFLGMITW